MSASHPLPHGEQRRKFPHPDVHLGSPRILRHFLFPERTRMVQRETCAGRVFSSGIRKACSPYQKLWSWYYGDTATAAKLTAKYSQFAQVKQQCSSQQTCQLNEVLQLASYKPTSAIYIVGSCMLVVAKPYTFNSLGGT
eukprot:scpid89681/ scgid17994/ 